MGQIDSQAYGHVVKAVSEKHWRINFYQVLGRQVALGEDEEAPEDPGAVGWLFIWCKRDEQKFLNIPCIGQPVEVHGWDSGLKLGQVHTALEKS